MQGVLLSSDFQGWETPPDVFASLSLRYGPFDLDVCATPSTAKCDVFFSPETDGLSQPWWGRCWMNPPYGREIREWVAKARREAEAGRATTVGLIPARTDTTYWHEHIFGIADVEFLRGRIRFWREGAEVGTAPFPSAVVVWRAHA